MSSQITDQEIKENFALVDTEGTGIIKRDQIEILMRALGYSPSPQELTKYKELDLKTFMEIMPRKRTLISKDAIRKAMTVLEKHGNGGVSPAMMKHMVTSVGEKLTPKEFDEFLNEIELGNDGNVNIDSKIFFKQMQQITKQAILCIQNHGC